MLDVEGNAEMAVRDAEDDDLLRCIGWKRSG
jgi:hypothetical protein